MLVKCNVSLGELVDKIAILRIKQKNITDPKKRDLASEEEKTLMESLNDLKLKGMDDYLTRLEKINSELWDIEDKIRDLEREGRFDDEFIQVARSVYISNDKRFEIKNEINNSFGSTHKEVKSYKKY